MPTAEANGISIYYETLGEGPPLLLLPGLGLEVADLGRLIDPLSRRCAVTALDNRGCGRTSQPPGPYSIPQMADDAVGLLDRLEVDRIAVLGISMGGKIGLDLAIRRPGRVARLILVGAQFRARRHTPFAVRLGRVARVVGVGRGRNPQSVAAFDAQARASAQYDCADLVNEVRAPTLVIHGERDRTAPFAQAKELAERLPDARLVPFRGGHIAFLFSARDLVVREVGEFVSG